MSRIGKQQISLPDKVEVEVSGGRDLCVKGPKGQLHWVLPHGISLEQEGGNLSVSRDSESRELRAMHGTARSLVANMVQGVSHGFTKELEIVGVGFRAAVKGSQLNLTLGYSHPVNHDIPEGIRVTVENNTNIRVEGIDKQLVGQFSAEVRSYYPPEPYKGKGVHYKGEKIRRKQGKSVR